jgi:hypothetical protein
MPIRQPARRSKLEIMLRRGNGRHLVTGFAILLLAPLLQPQSALAAETFEKVGVVGAQFLQIQPDPRGEALGGAYSSVTKGASGVHWNPAGLAFASGVELADQGIIADEICWLSDVRVSFKAVAVPLGSVFDDLQLGTICIWTSRLRMDPLPETTEYRPDGTGYSFDVKGEAVGYSYAYPITESLGLGITYKRIRSRLPDYESNGHGVDLGGAFHETLNPTEDVELEIGAGAGLRNLGNLNLWPDSSTDLPRQGYIAVAPTLRGVPLWDWLVEMTLPGELMYDDVLDRWTTMGGIEIVLLDCIAARYGKHNAEASTRQDSWGLGVAARYGDIAGLAFDYSRTKMDFSDDVKRYMLVVRFLGCSEGLDIKALIEALPE